MKKALSAAIALLVLSVLATGCKKEEKQVTILDDVNSARIGVLTGSAGDLAARKRFPRARFQDFTTAADAALAIRTNKTDAFVYDKSVLLNLAAKNPDLAILPAPVAKLEVAAAIRKDNETLLAELNGVLQALEKEGILKDLKQKWVDSGYSEPPALPPVDTPGARGVLKMGTCATLELFSFNADGKLTGLDIELARLIGKRLNKEVIVLDMSFEALIPALQSGKIDFALSHFNVTDERKKLVSFSLPYITNDISVLVRRSGLPPASASLSEKAGGLLGLADDLKDKGIAARFRANIILEKRYLLILDGLMTTVVISIFSTLFGTLLGAGVCAMRMAKRRFLVLPAKIYIDLVRGVPVLVLLMFIFYVVFASVNINSVIVAVIAFGMNFGAYTAEIFRTGIEGVDKGQSEAGISLGFTPTGTFIHIVLPQMVRRILPVYRGEFISLVKMTSIVGYIAVQDITKAGDIIRSRTFDAFFPLVMVAVIYFLISWGLMQFLTYFDRVLDPKWKMAKGAKP